MKCLTRCQIHGSEPRPPAEFTAPAMTEKGQPTHLCFDCLQVWMRSTGQMFVMRIGSSEPVSLLAIIERRKREGAA